MPTVTKLLVDVIVLARKDILEMDGRVWVLTLFRGIKAIDSENVRL